MMDLLTKAKERISTRSMYRYCQSPRFDSYCGGVEGRRSGEEEEWKGGGVEGRRSGGEEEWRGEEMDGQHKNTVIAARNS